MKPGKIFAEPDKGFHVRGQIFTFVINDIQIPAEGFLEGKNFYQVFPGILFYQQIGENRYSQSLGNGADNGLGAGAFPDRTDKKMLERKAGLQDLSSGASFFPH